MQYWEVGDTVTADALNALAAEIVSLERMVGNGGQMPRPRARGAFVPPEPMARGWEVRLTVQEGEPVARVRGGRVWETFGTDASEGDGQGRLLREARWVEPLAADTAGGLPGWRDVPVPEQEKPQVLWLVARGGLTQADVVYTVEKDRCAGWYGEHTTLDAAPAYSLEWEPDDTALRCWPLAVVQTAAPLPHAVVQLLWGDLCLFDVQGVCDEGGELLPPLPVEGGEWGDTEGMATLCAMKFETEKESVNGELHARMDEHGGLELFLEKVRVWDDGGGGDEPEPVEPPGGGGGGGGDDPWEPDDDDDDDDDKKRKRVTDPDGYYYTAASPLVSTYARATLSGRMGYRFTISSRDFDCIVNETVRAIGTLTVSTANSSGTYDWEAGNAHGLTMFYGVEAQGAAVTVLWRSSFQGGDTLAKTAEATVVLTADITANAWIDDNFVADSEHAPTAYKGNILSFTPDGSTTRRGAVWVVDPLTGKRVRVLKKRTFERYRVGLRLGVLREIARNKARAALPLLCTVQPPTVTGSCSNIDPPVVSAGAVVLRAETLPVGETQATGPLQPTFAASYEGSSTTVSVRGGAAWNGGRESGSISGGFTITLPDEEKRLN